MNKHHVTISMCGCVSAWPSGKPSEFKHKEPRFESRQVPKKKGFQIRALKNEEILGVVPIKVPVAQRQSVYNTVVSHYDSQESEMKMVIAS